MVVFVRNMVKLLELLCRNESEIPFEFGGGIVGYDADIVAFKKKTLQNIQEVLPDYSFRDLYSNYLFTRIYPDEYNFPEDEKAQLISSPCRDLFNEFFDGNFENEEARVIYEETYYKFYHWLEDKLRNTTLYNLIDSDMDEQYIGSLVDTYKNMRDVPVDFETEFVVFQHDW